MLKGQNYKFPLFKKRKKLESESNFKVVEGKYYLTRGGWLSKVIYINNMTKICYVVHNPGTDFETGPVIHNVDTGYAISISMIGFITPPTYSGHPADLIKEVKPN